MSAEFQVTLDAIQSILERLENPGELLRGPITDQIRSLFARRFASGGGFGGEPWEELSPESLKRKEKDGILDEGILVGTGILRESLTERDTLSGFEELRDPQTVAIGTRDPVAVLHEYGTKRGLPKREITPSEVPEADLDAMADLVSEYVVEGSLGSGSLGDL